MRFVVDPEASVVEIDARSSLHAIHGQAKGMTGVVELADGQDGWSIVAGASRLSVPVEGVTAGNALEDSELRRRVEAGRYPEITGLVTAAERGATIGTLRVTGDLTFHGVTRSVSGDLRISVAEGIVQLSGEHTLDVRDYGVQPPKLLLIKVDPEVRVRLRMTARSEVIRRG